MGPRGGAVWNGRRKLPLQRLWARFHYQSIIYLLLIYDLLNVKQFPKIFLLEKILRVSIEESDHVRTGWWIDFRNVCLVQNGVLSDDELD